MKRTLIFRDIAVIVAVLCGGSVASLVAQTTDKVDSQRGTTREASQQANQGRVVLQRLNRIEYQNTMRDLLGINVDLKELLPQVSSAGGSTTSAKRCIARFSLMDQYLDAADNPPPKPLAKRKSHSGVDAAGQHPKESHPRRR